METDSYAFVNLLIGPRILDEVEGLLPVHRERLVPPTETLSLFLTQALSDDGSSRQVVDETARQADYRCSSDSRAWIKIPGAG